MPKRKPENKAAVVREVLDQNPKAPIKEIVAILAAKRIKVSGSYVYMVKNKTKAKKKRQKAMAVASNNACNPIELIRGIKDLAEKAGGLKKLKDLVDVLVD